MPNPVQKPAAVAVPVVGPDDDCSLIVGDCVERLSRFEESTIDAVVTDPPYLLSFMNKAWDGHDGEVEDSAFGYYLSGLVDGEGCFRIQKQGERGTFSCSFILKLRSDDEAILRKACTFLGVGTLSFEDRGDDQNPMVRLTVQNKADCLRVVEVFTRYPLRAKKLVDFLTWSEAVVEWNNMKRGHRWSGKADWSRMERLKEQLATNRDWQEIPWSGNPAQDQHRMWAAAVYRVLKPGAYMLCFGGTRTFHRLACAVEDAGFEIRDCVMWVYAVGFPKSLDVSKAIDKHLGAQREKANHASRPGMAKSWDTGSGKGWNGETAVDGNPVTAAAAAWDGWGTALKPAWEPVLVCRKPPEGSIAENVLKHGVGGLNIDGCRVGTEERWNQSAGNRDLDNRHTVTPISKHTEVEGRPAVGRWPANLVHDGSDEVLEAFAAFGESKSRASDYDTRESNHDGITGFTGHKIRSGVHFEDAGTAARFFYCAKANAERDEFNKHPTLKPVALMEWLVKLVCPKDGLVLDPFTGSGTTAIACANTGRKFVGCEKDESYAAIAKTRMAVRKASESISAPVNGQPGTALGEEL